MESAIAFSKIEKRKQGRALREKCPRTSQAAWKPRSKSQDIVKWLEESDADRIPGLIPLKYQRMAVSPFTFFRGAAIIQARDLANAPVSGIAVQACGDCHLANFGVFASPERKLVFDINDFDETFPGAWEWDLKRLGASLVLAARDRNFSKSIADDVVRAAAASYRERMSEFAEMEVLDRWYAQVSIDDLKAHFGKDPAALALLSKEQKQARSHTSEAVVPKLTAIVDGRRQIKDDPPVLFHFKTNAPNFEREHRNHIERYRKSLPADRLELFERHQFHDTAVKVVGVGSVGTRCYLGLLFAEGDEPLFLQTKEARRSVLESPRGKSRFANQGFRVVTGQRLMQAASDIFLGWFRSAHGHDYYVRQFRDMKVSAELETFRPGNLVGYATACGWALARAHAKAGDAPMIAGYLGSTSRFDDALVQYARAYADQAERDFATFKAAIRSRRLSTDVEKGAGLEFVV
ncbi:DUF2252 domain-containing protein [Edaphobacter aggregans]|uniref:DUF2252 domain-containing protein n=1 Tax=Edaphobacter aggregans TaxID=570835 RepID=UPI000557DE49|nr:DUF2252 domain-containing protein [Edaphobacter aggregans]